MNGPDKMIEVCGPESARRFLEDGLLRSGTGFAYPALLRAIEPWEKISYGDITVTAAPLAHRIETLGYRIEEKERAGRFDVDRARSLGVPHGPLYGELKRGESITLEDGRVIDGRELCGPPQPGTSVVYCCDTIYTPDAVELARGADLLIHEATFSNRHADLAEQRGHSTTGMAARVAAEAGVRRLVITHISPRYTPAGDIGPDELLREAREIFPATEIAHDLMTLEVTG
jgi:ribonuclease Z